MFIFSSCNTTRRVSHGQYLLTHNTVIYSGHMAKGRGVEKTITSLTKQQLAGLTLLPAITPQYVIPYVKQKPNTKIMGIIPLHLLVYNLIDPEKTKIKKAERNQRIDARNKTRIAKGKKGLSGKRLKTKEEKRTFREWVMSVGEPPVILDSTLVSESVRQITLFLNSQGYFGCKVRDSVSVKNKKAKVFYILTPGKPYKIDSVYYTCADKSVLPLLYADSSNCLINRGDNYSLDVLLKERDRITNYLNDRGYYEFSKEYISFILDTGTLSHRMSVGIDIQNYSKKDTLNPDSVIEAVHPVFYIRKVTVQMQYNPSVLNYTGHDTVFLNDDAFVYPTSKERFKPSRLLSKIFIKKGDKYSVSNVNNTYAGLTELKTFRYVNIKFITHDDTSLDCYIQLMPSLKQSIGVEAVGTYTGGDLGFQGDIVYQNKNLLKGSELLQIKPRGGLEAQGNATTENNGIKRIIQLNTIDVGGEVDLTIPRPLSPFNLGANIDSTHIFKHQLGLWPKANPRTILKATYNYQKLPLNYARNIFGMAYTFNYTPYTILNQWHIEIKLPEVNYVNATLFQKFNNYLLSTHDFFLLNNFTNHFVPDMGFTLTNSNQLLSKRSFFHFFKVDVEESGYLLRAFTPVFSNNFSTHAPQLKPVSDASYSIAGVPYSYYVKTDADYREYIVLTKDDKIALREFAGIGIPMAGVPQELPFDKSFWAGGANDIRGWLPRVLGPGGYSQTTIIDQIGDIKLEGNAEYRVNVIKLFGLGFFIDAGNIWLLHPNPAIPNGNFLWSGTNGFINQIAVAGGVGLRFDFTYFVFRIDFGYPLRDPSMPAGQEWAKPKQWTLSKVVPQFGIGYPF